MRQRPAPRRSRASLTLGCAALALSVAAPARAGDLVRATLLSEVSVAAPGVPFTAAVRLQVPAGWHVYWRNPGDSGQAPKLRWVPSPGMAAGPIQWPTPHLHAQGPLVDFILSGDVWLLVEISPARALGEAKNVRLAVDADWLVCQDECIPEKAALLLEVPLAARPALGPDAPGFAAARERVPRRLGWRAELGGEKAKEKTFSLHVATGALPLPGATARFFPSEEGLLEPAAEQGFEPEQAGFTLGLTRHHRAAVNPLRLSGVVVLRGHGEADEVSAEISTAPAQSPEVPPLLPAWVALLFAFSGGLLLNLMPCVLPVLGVKVIGFVRQAQDEPRRARAHGLAFAAGVVVSFWVLALTLSALRASGAELGWGFQLQSPIVVSLLAFLFFALGLSFLGFVELGVSVQTAAGAVRFGDGLGGSFGSGVLATAVATPCTAPFMGAALGTALVAPQALSFAIFTLLGVGMSLPYVVLTFWPALLRRVPRPGPWMLLLQQALAFPLFGSVVWLLSVLSAQAGSGRVLLALGGLTTLAFALWIWRVTGAPESPPQRRRAGGALALAVALVAVLSNSGSAPREGAQAPQSPGDREPAQMAWVDWSEERLASYRAEGRLVFVDYTAAWCLTCQVNERVVFSSKEVRDRFAALGVVPMRADWTRADPAITRALAAFGRSGVPLNLVQGPASVEVLPSVLTPGLVLAALDRLAAQAQRP